MKTIKQLQEFIGATPDGLWGPKSKAAIDAILNQSTVSPPTEDGQPEVDSRSEGNIATLHPKVRPIARQFIIDAAMQGITAKITSGTRTYAEQDALFAKGGVTKARGGYSNHNFGIAFDVTVFKNGQPKYEGPEYKTLGGIGKKLGLSWGGDWHSFVDEPHFEKHPEWAHDMDQSTMLAHLRDRRSKGQDAFA